MKFAEGCCFRATPLRCWKEKLILRTLDQEKAKEHLEDVLDGIFANNELPPPRKKPLFEPGDWWALRTAEGSWERVQVCKEERLKRVDRTKANFVVVDKDGHLIEMTRSNPDLHKIPKDKELLIADIPPICHTVIVDPAYTPDPKFVFSLTYMADHGMEIMCMVRRIDQKTKMPVVVWFPSLDLRSFEQRVSLNRSGSLAEANAAVKAIEEEAADVYVIWLTAEKSAFVTFSVVFGNPTCGDKNAWFYRFRERQNEVQAMAFDAAPWDWKRGLPAVGAKVLYECDGVRKLCQRMGSEWVRAVVCSVEMKKVVISLLDLGHRKVLVTEPKDNCPNRLRLWNKTLDKFDQEPAIPVVLCRLQGFETNSHMRLDDKGFLLIQNMNDMVLLFSKKDVDALGNVVHQTRMWVTDCRRQPVPGVKPPFVNAGTLLMSADLVTDKDDNVAIIFLMKNRQSGRQFPVCFDALIGWPQNQWLSNCAHIVQVLRADGPDYLVVQLLNEETRQMMRTLAAMYKIDSLVKNVTMAELPLEQQFFCVVRLNLNEYESYREGVFPPCASSDGTIFARALVIRRKLWTSAAVVLFYAMDWHLSGKVPIQDVYHLFDLVPLRYRPMSIVCRMNIAGKPDNEKRFQTTLMSKEFCAVFGPPPTTPTNSEDRRYVWLLHKDGRSLDEDLIGSNGLLPPYKTAAGPPFTLDLMQEDFAQTSARQTGRFLYDVCLPKFVDRNNDGVYDFEMKEERTAVAQHNIWQVLPKLVVQSRIEQLDSATARALLPKLPIDCQSLDAHLKITPMIAPVSSTMGPNGRIYSSRLYLALADDRGYDVAAMLTAWKDTTKFHVLEHRLRVRESRPRGAFHQFYLEPRWPVEKGVRVYCKVLIVNTTPNVVCLRPYDWLRWQRTVFNRCQELNQAGQLKRLSDLRLGAACVVRWNKDQKMHRAEIVSLSTDNEATVYFVDNGNRATEVPHTELFVPPPDLLAIPKLLFFVQELYYGPAKEGDSWSPAGSKAYAKVVGKRVVAELVAGPMVGGVYDMVLYRPTYGNDNLSHNVRVMEKLHFESMCCERVADVDKCRRNIALASKVVFLKSWPRSVQEHPVYIRCASFLITPDQFYVVHKGRDGAAHEEWKSLFDSVTENVSMVHLPPSRVWPGRLVAVPYQKKYYRAVILSVDQLVSSVEIAFLDWGNRLWVWLDELIELCPVLLEQPCHLLRMRINGPINDSVFGLYDAHVGTRLRNWVQAAIIDSPTRAHRDTQQELRAHCRTQNFVDGVPEFVVDLEFNRQDGWKSVLEMLPKSTPSIRRVGYFFS